MCWKIHESHKEFLLSVDGGMCRSDDPRFDMLFFFRTNRESPSFLGSMIYENRIGLNIPIANATDRNLLFINQENGSVLFGGNVVADSLETFFITFCHDIGSGGSPK